MPTLFRFLMIVGLFVGSIAGGLYVLAEYFQPEPKEISKALRNVKVRADEQTTGSAPGTAAPRRAPMRARLPLPWATSPAGPGAAARNRLAPLRARA